MLKRTSSDTPLYERIGIIKLRQNENELDETLGWDVMEVSIC